MYALKDGYNSIGVGPKYWSGGFPLRLPLSPSNPPFPNIRISNV